MTIDALRSTFARLVVVMLDDVVAPRRMALRTGRVAGKTHLLGVRIMAVRATDARRVHLALQERAPDEDLVLLLTVGVVQPLAQGDREEVIEQRIAGTPTFRELAAPRMAGRADGVPLRFGTRLTASGVAALRIDRPSHTATFVEQHGEPAVCALRAAACPLQVSLAGTVTGFTADRDFGVTGVVAALRVVMTLTHLRRVTVGAHDVPVLRATRPVQFVAMIERLLRVLTEPALATLGLGARVPSDRHGLQAAARQCHKVLLLRLDAEGVLHLEIGEPSVRAVRADDELAVAFEERRGDAVAGVGPAAEIAEHGLLGRMLHGTLVLRAPPGGML